MKWLTAGAWPPFWPVLTTICLFKAEICVAMELICNRPPLVKWEPNFNGSKEPYYDFVGMKQNGSTRNIVYYQLVKYGGITCMHTLLFEGRWPVGKSLENVRWYVAPPLARKILEITESLSAPQPGK